MFAVAQLPIRLALSSCFSHRSTVLTANSRSFLASTDIDCLVVRDADGPSSNISRWIWISKIACSPRQIAVMKGQAWNVVETLKQADHGPLELTRRTRVCVWDDLVDIPVAIPMRAPPKDIKRKKVKIEPLDEMDIGASHATSPPTSRTAPQPDLLGSPTSELPNP